MSVASIGRSGSSLDQMAALIDRKQVMLERDATKRLTGRCEINDAYVGGERAGASAVEGHAVCRRGRDNRRGKAGSTEAASGNQLLYNGNLRFTKCSIREGLRNQQAQLWPASNAMDWHGQGWFADPLTAMTYNIRRSSVSDVQLQPEPPAPNLSWSAEHARPLHEPAKHEIQPAKQFRAQVSLRALGHASVGPAGTDRPNSDSGRRRRG